MSVENKTAAFVSDVAAQTAPDAGHLNLGELLTPTNACILAISTIAVRAVLKTWQNLSETGSTLADPSPSNTDEYMNRQNR